MLLKHLFVICKKHRIAKLTTIKYMAYAAEAAIPLHMLKKVIAET